MNEETENNEFGNRIEEWKTFIKNTPTKNTLFEKTICENSTVASAEDLVGLKTYHEVKTTLFNSQNAEKNDFNSNIDAIIGESIENKSSISSPVPSDQTLIENHKEIKPQEVLRINHESAKEKEKHFISNIHFNEELQIRENNVFETVQPKINYINIANICKITDTVFKKPNIGFQTHMKSEKHFINDHCALNFDSRISDEKHIPIGGAELRIQENLDISKNQKNQLNESDPSEDFSKEEIISKRQFTDENFTKKPKVDNNNLQAYELPTLILEKNIDKKFISINENNMVGLEESLKINNEKLKNNNDNQAQIGISFNNNEIEWLKTPILRNKYTETIETKTIEPGNEKCMNGTIPINLSQEIVDNLESKIQIQSLKIENMVQNIRMKDNIISCLQKEIELLQLAKLDYDREETTQSALKAIELINKIKQNTQKAAENKELKNEQLNNKILKNLIADLIVKLKDEKEKKINKKV